MALTRLASVSSHKQNIHPIEHSNNNRQMQSGNLGIWAIGEFGNLGDRGIWEFGRSVDSLANRANAIRPYDTPHFSNADRNADGPILSISNDRPGLTISNASKNALTPSAGLVG